MENPAATTIRRFSGPATTNTGKRVPRSGLSDPFACTVRRDRAPVIEPVSRRASMSEASVNDENGSNGAKAPPAERARTLSHLPGVPKPRMPNWESWAAKRPNGMTASTATSITTATAVRPSDRPVVTVSRTGIASRT